MCVEQWLSSSDCLAVFQLDFFGWSNVSIGCTLTKVWRKRYLNGDQWLWRYSTRNKRRPSECTLTEKPSEDTQAEETLWRPLKTSEYTQKELCAIQRARADDRRWMSIRIRSGAVTVLNRMVNSQWIIYFITFQNRIILPRTAIDVLPAFEYSI